MYIVHTEIILADSRYSTCRAGNSSQKLKKRTRRHLGELNDDNGSE